MISVKGLAIIALLDSVTSLALAQNGPATGGEYPVAGRFGRTVRAIVAIVKNKLAQKAPWLALPLGALAAWGESQESEGADREAGSRRGLEALSQRKPAARAVFRGG